MPTMEVWQYQYRFLSNTQLTQLRVLSNLVSNNLLYLIYIEGTGYKSSENMLKPILVTWIYQLLLIQNQHIKNDIEVTKSLTVFISYVVSKSF